MDARGERVLLLVRMHQRSEPEDRESTGRLGWQRRRRLRLRGPALRPSAIRSKPYEMLHRGEKDDIENECDVDEETENLEELMITREIFNVENCREGKEDDSGDEVEDQHGRLGSYF